MVATINGKSVTLDASFSLEQVLASHHIDSRMAVVEVNLAMIDRSSLASTFVKDGDTIEILRFVGGG
jgi:thiamine biosynthesis protein ThiS